MTRLILLVLLLLPSLVYSNDYYQHGSFPSPGSPATSAAMRAELDLIAAGFDKLPSLSGNANKLLIVNGSGTALTTLPGTISIPQSFTINGNYPTTLNVSGATSVTLPQSGTVATLAGTETLTNKTLVSPTITGNLVASGSGPHVIGQATASTGSQLLLSGTFSPTNNSWSSALSVRTTINAQANQDAYGAVFWPTINKASTGTHPWVYSIEANAPVIDGGAATVTNAATIRITSAPQEATNNYALYVNGGRIETHGGIITIGVAGANTNPYLQLYDGSTSGYVQLVNNRLNLYSTLDQTFSPGSSEKMRLTDNGVLLVGSTAKEPLPPGGLGIEGGIRMTEISDPVAPASNRLMLYARDDGSGNTVLAVRFPTGDPITIARENVGVIPPGTIHLWGGGAAPSGWLLTNGNAVSRTTYAALFGSIGTTFGSGDGSTTFNVPNIANLQTNVKYLIKCRAKLNRAWTPTLVPRSSKSEKPWRTIEHHTELAQAA